MHADSYTAMGARHLICQDYARSGALDSENSQVFAMLADGCSSSADSDVGARLLVFAAMAVLQERGRLCGEEVVCRGAALADALGIDRGCLDATLLAAWQEGDRVHLWCQGDGVVAARRRDGQLVVWTCDESGAPGYLSYQLKRDRRQQYLAAGFGERALCQTRGPHEIRCVGDTALTPWTMAFDARDYELVVLLSDGAQSFRSQQHGGGALPLRDVLEHVLALQSRRGAFMVRRCRRFLQKQCRELGVRHEDDFAVAAILLEPET